MPSVVVVTRFRRGLEGFAPDDPASVVVVALCTPGGAAAGVTGSAMAIPPPSDRPPTISRAPPPARAWLVRLPRSIGRTPSPDASTKEQSAQTYHWHHGG